MRVDFEIPGRAAPKGSRTVGFRKDGSVYTREQSKQVGPWMKGAKQVFSAHDMLSPPYAVQVEFIFERPKKPKYEYPSRGDLDKFLRSLLDSMTGFVIEDDRFVLDIKATKSFGQTEITRGWVEEIA
jgi:Holliday junction resolvase RusA-like endonuclease